MVNTRPHTTPAASKGFGRTRLGALVSTCVCAALTAAGCSSLPTSGQPQAFDADVPTPSAVTFVAGAPVPRTTPEALVEGFLRACSAGTSDNFDTARLFLTQESARSWDPTASIQVYSTDATPHIAREASAPDGSIVVSVPAVASVDESGNLTESSGDTSIQMRYKVVPENGEWRIAALEDGILISLASFNASYQLSRVYFPMRTDDTLGFEAHWYPRKKIVRYLMDAVLAGPSETVSSAMESVLPEDATLPANGIDINNGSATIIIEAPSPTPEQSKQILAAQVFQTLRQTAQVLDVHTFVAGELLSTSDLPQGPTYRLDAAIANGEEGVGTIAGGEYSPLRKLSATGLIEGADTAGLSPEAEERWEGNVKPTPESHLAISPVNPAFLSWADAGLLVAYDRASKQMNVVEVAKASWPSVDRFGWTWAVSNAGALQVINPAGEQSALNGLTSLEGLTSIRISPDGSRALLIRRIGQQNGAWLATIERDRYGNPRNIAHTLPLTKLSANVRDITWASSHTIVALHGANGEEASVVTIPLGGFAHAIPAPADAEWITAGPTSAAVYVTDKRGGVWLRVNTVWQPLDVKLRSLRFPG